MAKLVEFRVCVEGNLRQIIKCFDCLPMGCKLTCQPILQGDLGRAFVISVDPVAYFGLEDGKTQITQGVGKGPKKHLHVAFLAAVSAFGGPGACGYAKQNFLSAKQSSVKTVIHVVHGTIGQPPFAPALQNGRYGKPPYGKMKDDPVGSPDFGNFPGHVSR